MIYRHISPIFFQFYEFIPLVCEQFKKINTPGQGAEGNRLLKALGLLAGSSVCQKHQISEFPGILRKLLIFNIPVVGFGYTLNLHRIRVKKHLADR